VGLGSIVLVADSYLFSNEALWKDRYSAFLLWTAGATPELIFDESHLGLNAGSGITVALREFHLEGLFIGLLLLGALWVWQNSAYFVPPSTDPGTDSEAVVGKTAREGILHLLERNIPASELPQVCLEEWRKSQKATGDVQAGKAAEASRVLENWKFNQHTDLVELYRKLSSILSKKSL
jgi:hypothetical protein